MTQETESMARGLGLLQQLIPLVERYTQQERPQRLEAFMLWCLAQPDVAATSLAPRMEALSRAQPVASEDVETKSAETGPAFEPLEGYGPMRHMDEVGRLIDTLMRRIRQTAKTLMTEDPIATLDDFGLMATLLAHPGIHKTELISHNRMELSSGSDNLARLIRAGLMAEAVDPADRRMRRLNLTPAGHAAVLLSFQKMAAVSEAIFNVLEPNELTHLHRLLSKVELVQRVSDADSHRK